MEGATGREKNNYNYNFKNYKTKKEVKVYIVEVLINVHKPEFCI